MQKKHVRFLTLDSNSCYLFEYVSHDISFHLSYMMVLSWSLLFSPLTHTE